MIAAIGPTQPEAGVIVTNPATAPDAAPTMLGFRGSSGVAKTQLTLILHDKF
jgi:hypothetical protein